MKLIINGESKEVRNEITVQELLEIEKVEMPQYVSVQLNEEFVRSDAFSVTRLRDGDRVDFMYFMGGGSHPEEVAAVTLTADQVERYSRHIILEQVGLKGQQKLLAGSVLIVGAGGLGSPAAYYLAAAGVGRIGIVDFDRVDLSNLQRQIVHTTADVGRLKAESAAEKLRAINPDVKVEVYTEPLSSNNAVGIIAQYDFVIDGTDNFPAKFLVNDACYFARKPFSHAGILRFAGQTITVLPGETTCYRCIFPSPPPPNAVPSCAQAGVLGVLGGVMGTIQATEALKYLLGTGDLLTNRLLTYDALIMRTREIKVKRSADCPLCGDRPTITELQDEQPVFCTLKGTTGNANA
nr:sulfur carrier protein ThiS [Zhaonella formicivorans]